MAIPKLSCAAILAAALAATGFGVNAHAGVITLDVSGILTPVTGPAACTQTCTLGGDIVINNSTGAIISEDVAASGFSPSIGPFLINAGTGTSITIGGLFTTFQINDAGGDLLDLAVSTTATLGTLIGYAGGPIATFDSGVGSSDGTVAWDFTSGSLTLAASAVPEPPSLLLLLSALAGLGAVLATPSLLRRTAYPRA